MTITNEHEMRINSIRTLEILIKILNKAIKITEWFRFQKFQSFKKVDKSPVTLADFASQLYIISKLKEFFPNDSIIAEELLEQNLNRIIYNHIKSCYTSLNLEFPKKINEIINYRGPLSDYKWTVDPIDGTKGYIKGLSYAIGIGLMKNSYPMLSAIITPNYNEKGTAVFIAEKNQGAKASYGGEPFKPISVSDQDNLETSRMCLSLHYNKPWVTKFANLVNISSRIQIDSMAKFCKIADGSADFYLKPMNINRSFSWDFLPGTLLVQEAGGKISDITGNPVQFNNEKCVVKAPGMLATNGLLKEKILKELDKIIL